MMYVARARANLAFFRQHASDFREGPAASTHLFDQRGLRVQPRAWRFGRQSVENLVDPIIHFNPHVRRFWCEPGSPTTLNVRRTKAEQGSNIHRIFIERSSNRARRARAAKPKPQGLGMVSFLKRALRWVPVEIARFFLIARPRSCEWISPGRTARSGRRNAQHGRPRELTLPEGRQSHAPEDRDRRP